MAKKTSKAVKLAKLEAKKVETKTKASKKAAAPVAKVETYKLTAEAKKVGTSRFREGSARHKLAAAALKVNRPFTREEAAKVIGDQAGQVLRTLISYYGFLQVA